MALAKPRVIPTLVTDLGLIGYTLGATAETCGCALCRLLDLKHDVDAIARGPDGRATLVAYRAQPEYDLQTITIRWINDNGNRDSQLAKLMEGRSWAHLYVQGYPSGVSYIDSVRLVEALKSQRTKQCREHEAALTGRDGQKFVVICGKCADMAYVSRSDGEHRWTEESYGRVPF